MRGIGESNACLCIFRWGIRMKKTELIVKSREAMMAAVQLYNNPQITFKTETFITLAIIAWTYLLHAYYANKRIDYRYFHMNGKRKIYLKDNWKF